MPDTIIDKAKKLQTMILTTFGIFAITAVIITSFSAVSNNSKDIGNLDARVVVLEKDSMTNHDLLLELKFNLKNHMETAGEKYIELDKKGK